jgi:hypothetical protein
MKSDHTTIAKLHPPITSSGACTPRYILDNPTHITPRIMPSFQGLDTYGKIMSAQTMLSAECPDGNPKPEALYCLEARLETSSRGLGRAIVSFMNCVMTYVAELKRKTCNARSFFFIITNDMRRPRTIQPLPSSVITNAKLYSWLVDSNIVVNIFCSSMDKFWVDASNVLIARILADTTRPMIIGCCARFPLIVISNT